MGHTLDDIAKGFKQHPAHERLVIDAVRMPDGRLTTLDNSRPAVRKTVAGGFICVRERHFDEPLAKGDAVRFTALGPDGDILIPHTWGEAVQTRIQRSAPGFGERHPFGMLEPPVVTGAPEGSIWDQLNQQAKKRSLDADSTA